jgi:hypothetical protein
MDGVVMTIALRDYIKADGALQWTFARIESSLKQATDAMWENEGVEVNQKLDQLLKLAEVQVNYLKIMHYQYQAQEDRKI